LYRLDEIVPALIRSGYAPETPAAAIESGGLPEQRVCRSTLGKLGEKTARQGFDSPTLIVVGEVVGLTSPPPPD
jgi:siroheme synthase